MSLIGVLSGHCFGVGGEAPNEYAMQEAEFGSVAEERP